MQVLWPKSHRSINAGMPYYFPSPGMNEIFVLCKQQYPLTRKYCWAYKSVSSHLKLMCCNNSLKMADSDEGAK